MIETTLDKLKLGQKGVIVKVLGKENIIRRLLDLGLIEGTEVKPVLISPSKDPKAFEFRGNLIAIRKEDTINIKIKVLKT